MEGSITLICERGTVKIGGKYMNTVEYQHGIDLKCEQSAPANNYGDYEGSMSNHDKMIDNVIANILDGTDTIVNAKEGAQTVELIERIYETA